LETTCRIRLDALACRRLQEQAIAGKKWCLLAAKHFPQPSFLGWHGAVAQLIERFVRNEEVVGLIPICSTILDSNGGGGPESDRLD
jgi:hypothetical protein